VLRLLGSPRGLRVQLLLWTVLPLTLVLVGVAILGISTHQRSMREMVEELDARSARLAVAHLSDELDGRVALLLGRDRKVIWKISRPAPWPSSLMAGWPGLRGQVNWWRPGLQLRYGRTGLWSIS
jgi:hypothetical protein